MGPFNTGKVSTPPRPEEVYRVIDDGYCVLTTLNAQKALIKLIELIDEHEINAFWVDVERLK